MTRGRCFKLPLLRLIAVQVCIHACMAGTRLAAPLLALRQGHSAAAVGVLLALFALTQVFLAVPAGRYADRHSLRRPVAISVVLTVVGPFATGLVIDYAGFRPAFALMAVLPLLSWWLVRNTAELPASAARLEAGDGHSWELLDVPQLRRLLLVNWLLATCWDVHTFVLPVLGYERGFSASVIGTILGVFAVAATLVRLLMPVLAARLREPAVIAVAMASTACLFVVYPLLPSALAMGFCSLLLGFVLGSVQPMILSALHQLTPEHRHGEALGLRMMTINASSALMPVLFGTAGAAVGAAAAAGTRTAWRLRIGD